MVTLFGDLESGNVHKVQLVLRRAGIAYDRVDVSQARGDTRRPEFLALNPIGKVPTVVLDDADVLSESGALLYFFGVRSALWPADERWRAEVLRWMFFEQYSHEPALAVLRYLRCFVERPEEHAHRIPDLESASRRVLTVLDRRLGEASWIATPHATIADYALYPHSRWANEAGIDLAPYPSVARWLHSVEALPDFIPLRTDGARVTLTFDEYFCGSATSRGG